MRNLTTLPPKASAHSTHVGAYAAAVFRWCAAPALMRSMTPAAVP
jgi:hypothetical protein